MAAEGAVDGALVNERVAALSGQDLPLLLVEADVGVGAKGYQGNNHVQPVVGRHRIKRLCQQTLCSSTNTREIYLEANSYLQPCENDMIKEKWGSFSGQK